MSDALRMRLADIFDVDPAEILPVRGVLHAKELAMRLAAQGDNKVAYADDKKLDRLAAIYGVDRVDGGNIVIRKFDEEAPTASLVLFDESEIEYSGRRSAAGMPGVAVIRNAADAPCAAIVATRDLIKRFAAVVEPDAIPEIIVKAAMDELAPHRLAATRMKIEKAKAERRRLAEQMAAAPEVEEARECERPAIFVRPKNNASFRAILRAYAIGAEQAGVDAYLLRVGEPAANDRLRLGFGLSGRARRTGESRRETLETKIVAIVDLDREGEIAISTGVGFFDHMLTQIAHHAGISMTLSCAGDLDVDAHHTIEDCAIAFGETLSRALGDRRGIQRFGFLLPMDEAEAKISVDLGGRPYLVFNADFKSPLIGAYPTEMTAHVFRSLSQSLGASIHIAATGDNDHHKTEACYKAFGRALRQALRVEGAATPSTKGVI